MKPLLFILSALVIVSVNIAISWGAVSLTYNPHQYAFYLGVFFLALLVLLNVEILYWLSKYIKSL